MLAAYQGQIDDTFWERVSFYAWIIPFHEVLYGLLTGDRAHVQAGVRALKAGFS